MTKFALMDDCIPYSPTLGALVGCCGALLIQQVHYWCKVNERDNKNFKDGYYWTFNTHKQWQEAFKFWEERSIRRQLAALTAMGLLVVGRFNRVKYDKTNWYRVDYEVLEASLVKVRLANLSGSTGQNVQTDAAKMSGPIPETTGETKAETSLASPEPSTPTIIDSEVSMLPKNNSKKGPTLSQSVVADILAPSSVKKETVVMSLYKIWATLLPKHHPEVKFVAEFNIKQKGFMSQCGRLWGSRSESVLRCVIEHWTKFGKFVTANAGTKTFPEIPRLEYLVKHKELAINFFLSFEQPKDGPVQLTATAAPSSVVKTFGKITLKKGTQPDLCASLAPQPPAAVETPAAVPVVEDEEDDSPVSLEFLLQQKFGKKL